MIIYKLTSPSGKSYIGVTKQTIDVRFQQHVQAFKRFRRMGYLENRNVPLLYRAFNKYGTEDWIKEQLDQSDDLQTALTLEIKYIGEYDTTKTGYNIHEGGRSGWAGKTLNEAHKDNISKSRLYYWNTIEGQEWKENLREKLKGNQHGKLRKNTKHSDETKQKIGAANKGQTRSDEQKEAFGEEMKRRWANGIYKNRPPKTAETIEKIRQANIGRKQTKKQKKAVTEANSKKWIVTFPDGHTEEVFNLNQFCRTNSLDCGNLQQTQPGGRARQHKGYSIVKSENV